MAAAVRGHKEVLEILLKAGADVNAQNTDGHTALFFAYNGLNQVASLLDKYGEYIQGENDNNTKIIKDALDLHNQVVDILKKHGADETIKDKEGHTAADYGYKPAAKEGEAPAIGEKVKEEL